VGGYAGAQQKSRFSMVAKASNRYCLATFSIISAMHLMKSAVKKVKAVTTSQRSPI